jgi:hypothetical protein
MDSTGEYQTAVGSSGSFFFDSTTGTTSWTSNSSVSSNSVALVNDGTNSYQTTNTLSTAIVTASGVTVGQNTTTFNSGGFVGVAMGLGQSTQSSANIVYTTAIQNPGYIYTSSTSYTPPTTTNSCYGLKGSLSSGTNNSYMWPGTQSVQRDVYPDPTGALVTISKACVLSKLFAYLKTPAGDGNVVSVMVEYTPKGGKQTNTPYFATVVHPNTNATVKNKNFKLQIGDKIHVKVGYTGGTTNTAKDLNVQLVFT